MSPLPLSATEQAFAAFAASTLPAAQIERNDHGILTYKWASPCPELEALYVWIDDLYITLATKISHLHVDRNSFARDTIREERLAHIIAEEAASGARGILDGRVVFIQYYDETSGKVLGQSGVWNRDDWVEENRRGTREAQRAWSWSGEVQP
ncbi:hypothetical protein [Sphingomonas jatrophae]|uniref:hypothetical protein n=1 Tax=Sphingomonas jatrophae TaxID=1166337 RepID=UPI001041CB0F|nr:hypothetical protein [Sphingomonas jatrophae]